MEFVIQPMENSIDDIDDDLVSSFQENVIAIPHSPPSLVTDLLLLLKLVVLQFSMCTISLTNSQRICF